MTNAAEKREPAERVYTLDFSGVDYRENEVGIRFVGPLRSIEAFPIVGVSRQALYQASRRDGPVSGCIYVENRARRYYLAVLPFGGSMIAWGVYDSPETIAESLGVRETLFDDVDRGSIIDRAARLALLDYIEDREHE